MYYISFVLKFLLRCGIVLEIPLFVYFLTKVGIIKPEHLRKNRKYVLLVILVLAAMLTPPDIISQLMLAAPMYLLYEISIKISSSVYNRKVRKEEKMQAKQAKKDAKAARKEAKKAAKVQKKMQKTGENLPEDRGNTDENQE